MLTKSALNRSMIAPENPCQAPHQQRLFRNKPLVGGGVTDSAQIAPVPERPAFVKNLIR
jgi:hypothetical protein